MTNLLDFRVTDFITQVLATQYNRVIDAALRGEMSNSETLTANKTLTDADFALHIFAPTAARDVTLPAVASTNHPFYIVNTAAFALTVKNAGGTTIGTVTASSYGMFVSSGSAWYLAGTMGAQVANQIGGTNAAPVILGIKESGGTSLTFGSITEGQAPVRSGVKLFGGLQTDGWCPSNGTATYVSSSSFTLTGDWRTVYTKGTKVKWVQGGTAGYGIVNSTAFGGVFSTISIYLLGSYALTNTAISFIAHATSMPLDWPREFSFTPSWTNLSLGNGTYNAAMFQVMPDRVRGHVELVFGSTTSISGNVSLAAPVASGITHSFIPAGNAALVDTSTFLYHGSVLLASGVLSVRCMVASGSYYGYSFVTATAPFTWATGDILSINFDYPY